MVRVGIAVEGQTEALFAKYALKRYLMKRGIMLEEPVILGGNVNIARVINVYDIMSENYDFVTSLYDFYGFQGKENGESCEDLIYRLKTSEILANRNNIIPYIQRYEFESLLFADPKILCEQVVGKDAKGFELFLERVLLDMGNKAPEEINDSPLSAPSKRIQKIFRQYKKTVYGFIIAQEIGIDNICAKCPRFDSWIKQLSNLNKNA